MKIRIFSGTFVRNNLASNIESKFDFAIRQVYVRVLVSIVL
jgi:hypothetical protein